MIQAVLLYQLAPEFDLVESPALATRSIRLLLLFFEDQDLVF